MNNNWFVSFWGNKRLRSLLFLFLWCIFIAFLVFKYVIPFNDFLAENSNNNNEVADNNDNQEDSSSIILEDYKNSLLKYNFDYLYTVNVNEEKIIYKGTMMGNETVGYKESSLGIEKYYLKGKQIYQNVLGENILVTDKTTSVYNNFLSIDYIMDLLLGQDYVQSGNQYDFQIDLIYVKINVGNDNITSIEISDGNISALLEFSNVNEIIELNY